MLIPLIGLQNTRKTPDLQVTTPVQQKTSQPESNVTEQEETVNMQEDDEKPANTTTAQVTDAASFSILDERSGKTFTVDTKDFVRGALAAELPPTFHPEALKAQAVAAHSYALYRRQTQNETPDASLQGADFTADPQNWKSYTTEEAFHERYGELAPAYWKNICEAADEVSSYLLTYDGEVIAAAYHSMSSGLTEDAVNVWSHGEPYLIPVESRGDLLAPDYETSVSFSVKEMRQALTGAYPEIVLPEDPTGWFVIDERSKSGYVLVLQAGDQTMDGKELRSLLELRSSDFDIDCDGESFTLTIRGYGHGVGLSQYGADYLARQGMNFEEILAHYYPGSALAVGVREK